ncbi:helix-turn-helix domain-containing protein [Haloechinothrix sp. LS1_15]|uniref:TetR/AcrR family transcriptional regulator n=1 Tax=Haloechinothrix sp. LS1_15 TaxID=2652248 RepID=UPI00294B18B2|nr:helix-turn-helix domain-containing protein [Haloechinothrix sp. LS1_15]
MGSTPSTQENGLRPANAIDEEHILDATYELLLAIGMRRMTMAEIARAAGVSRATLYRRWKSVREVVAALMTREWSTLVSQVFQEQAATGRDRLVEGIVRIVRATRTHPVMRKIVELDPDFLLPYLLQRRGRTAEQQLDLIEQGLRAGIADGSIRHTDVAMQAKSLLLTAWSFALTGPAFVDNAPTSESERLDELDGELRELLARYLKP